MEKEEKKENIGESRSLSTLGIVELEAMRLKFDGYNAQEIEKTLKQQYGNRVPTWWTIKNWFSTGRQGKLRIWYEDYVKKESEVRHQEAKDMFRAHLKNAIRTLVKLMNESPNDSVRISAAREIINRELGEPVKVIANTEKDPAQRILEELGVIEKKTDGGTTKEND
jgi:hypothetical protein